MKNVYDLIRRFYQDEVNSALIIRQEWVEGFFRVQAWQGKRDEDLRHMWQVLQLFIAYVQFSAVDDLEEMTVQEYSLAVEWLSGHTHGFDATLKNVREFFKVLLEFYSYLADKRIVSGFSELQQAAMDIAGGTKLNLIQTGILQNELGILGYDPRQSSSLPELSDDLARNIGEMVERLMVKLGSYFQQEAFNEDFDRALYLYTGPLDNVPDDGQEEFWLGFWDYFLFDYHLLANDKIPLAHFIEALSERLTVEERQILQDLLSARFTVFYVNRVLSQDWVECINLFTDEKFELPFLFEYKALKKMLFFGHVFSQGMVMINYVTSIEVSALLRKRMKEEVLRQYALYKVQEPQATLAEFFARHALVVRHTIDVLVTLARVNAAPTVQLERDFPQIAQRREANTDVIRLVEQVAPEYGFSYHDIRLMNRMWSDFSSLDKVIVRKAGVWAGALMHAYARINYCHSFTVDRLAKALKISASSIHGKSSRLYDMLQLQAFDLRYLSEEGFVFMLFMP